MKTLLQKLLIETIHQSEQDEILCSFIENVLPAMEEVFALTPALGGSNKYFSKNADQSLLTHVLNGLLTAWNLTKYLSEPLSKVEKRLLCLGFTLHDYDKYCYSQKIQTPGANQTLEIRELCRQLAADLKFQDFWSDWSDYLLDICFLAQNTQGKNGSNLASSNWEVNGQKFRLDYPDRVRLCELLRFGDIAVHMTEPSEASIENRRGKQLHKSLEFLNIDRRLTYHRLRDCRGLLTNQIHNAVVKISRELNYEPILYFAQGVVYITPLKPTLTNISDIQDFVWQNILTGDKKSNIEGLEYYFINGEIGLIRGPHGLKVPSLALELFSPAELIRQLPYVVKVKVANVKDPATPKRLERLQLSDAEQELLRKGADIWADRLAEYIVLVQREFFESIDKRNQYINWILSDLGLQGKILPEQTQVVSGGVNYGWYQAASHYIAILPTSLDRNPNSEEILQLISDFGDRLANWGEENALLPKHTSSTRDTFFEYLAQYLELSGLESTKVEFQSELKAYSEAKINNKPICSLSSGEFAAEDQEATVVLFKSQQYSNKNALGGGRIKRGISKIWSLEMLLRQAYWAAPAGKLEDQQPIFLYIFPAYVYSPQVACAVGVLVNQLQRANLWNIRTHWQEAEMQLSGLQKFPWLDKEPKPGRYGSDYSTVDLPFMAMRHTKTLGKTTTDTWIEPIFLALALPLLLGVKVVATASSDPLYASDQEFRESVILDGPAGFWNLLNPSTSLRLDELESTLERLLISYSLHLDNRSKKPDARWQAFNGTARDLVTDVLNVFAIANEGFRENKREPSQEDVKRVWKYAQLWIKGNINMSEKLQLIEKLVKEYRQFYQVSICESSHAVLLPISKALEVILTVPEQIERGDIILQAAGQLHDALERQEAYKRPFIIDKSVDFPTRTAQELMAIHTFMTTCVDELFLGLYKGDRALLQENRNRIKSGAEFAYRWLALQEKQTEKTSSKGEK